VHCIILKAYIYAMLCMSALQDVKVLRFAPNPDYREGQDVEGALVPQFRCPVTQMDFNGLHPFVAIWPTGWVLSEKAVRELGVGALQEEYGPFAEDDIIKYAISFSYAMCAQYIIPLALFTA
jgi:hypothetical protein